MVNKAILTVSKFERIFGYIQKLGSADRNTEMKERSQMLHTPSNQEKQL